MSDYAALREEVNYAYQYIAQLEALIPAGSLPDRPPQLAPRPGPPVNVDVPYVSGTGEIGSVLSCTTGNWQGEPTEYAYAWDAVGVDTSSATYTVDAADAGMPISCTVTATNALGSTAAPQSNIVTVPGAAAESASRSNSTHRRGR